MAAICIGGFFVYLSENYAHGITIIFGWLPLITGGLLLYYTAILEKDKPLPTGMKVFTWAVFLLVAALLAAFSYFIATFSLF